VSDEPGIEISVVIVTYENETEIAVCLDALFAELENFRSEVFIIDNASRDRTGEIVRKKAAQFGSPMQPTFIVNDVNLGFTKALNLGLSKCRGKFILVLNPDTRFQNGSLKILLDSLQTGEMTGVIAPQLINPDGTVQASCRRFPRRRDVLFTILGLSTLFPQSGFNSWKMGDFDHRQRRSVDQPQGACLLFRHDVLEKVGLWDERFPMFFSDVDWCRRVKQSGFDIAFEPKAKVVHQKGVSIKKKRAAMLWSSHKSFYSYFRKYSPNFWYGIADVATGVLLMFSAIPRMLAVWIARSV